MVRTPGTLGDRAAGVAWARRARWPPSQGPHLEAAAHRKARGSASELSAASRSADRREQPHDAGAVSAIEQEASARPAGGEVGAQHPEATAVAGLRSARMATLAMQAHRDL